MSAMIGKCSSCGADLKWDFGMEPKFCPNCGAKLSLDEGAPSSGETGGSSYGDGSYSGQSYEDSSYAEGTYKESSYQEDGYSVYNTGSGADSSSYGDNTYSSEGSYEDGSYNAGSSYGGGSYNAGNGYEDGSYNAGNSYGDGSYNAGSSYGDNTYGTEGSYGNNSYGTEGSYGDGSYGAGPDSYDQTQDLQGDIGKRAEALAAEVAAEGAALAEPAASAAAEPVPGTEEAPPHHTHTTAAKLSHYLGLAGITTAGTTDPGVYLNRLSATFLALLKLLEGIAGGIAFFFTAIALFPLIKGMISSGQQVISVDRLIEEYVRAFVPASINVDKYLESVKTGLNIPMLAVGIAAVLILVPLALIIVDAIASVFLRFFRTGAGTIKVIHLLCFVANLILFIVLLASFVLTMIGFFSLKLPIPEQVKEIGSALPPAAAYGIVFGITAAVILLLMCYHKDVAQAMKVVSHDIDTGARADMNYTRLPVICIILALISLVSIVGAGFSGMYSSGLPVGGLALIVLLAFSPLFGFVKYLLVAVCYTNLMKAE